MSHEIKQPPYFPAAVALSLLLHAAALAFWLTNSARREPIAQAIRLEAQVDNTLAVVLITLPSDHQRGSQHQLPPSPAAKGAAQAKKIKITPPRRAPLPDTPSSDPQKNKPEKQKAVNNLRQRPATKAEPLASAAARQTMKTLYPAKAYDNPPASIVNAAIGPELPAPVKLGGDVGGKGRSSPSNQASGANPANNSTATVSSLPPLVKSAQPRYPEEARWEERTGKVTIRFRISGRGRVIEPSITGSSGHRDLDLAAMQAIKIWQFSLKGGWNSSQWFFYSFRFELN